MSRFFLGSGSDPSGMEVPSSLSSFPVADAGFAYFSRYLSKLGLYFLDLLNSSLAYLSSGS